MTLISAHKNVPKNLSELSRQPYFIPGLFKRSHSPSLLLAEQSPPTVLKYIPTLSNSYAT